MNCSTDVWALGCCLYSLAFLQNCFEEGSNLAILSRNYKIPDDNPYGDGLVELIDRMLTVDDRARGDMTEVILCLSAIYSGRPLPPRRKVPKAKKKEVEKDLVTDWGKFRDKERGTKEDFLKQYPKADKLIRMYFRDEMKSKGIDVSTMLMRIIERNRN